MGDGWGGVECFLRRVKVQGAGSRVRVLGVRGRVGGSGGLCSLRGTERQAQRSDTDT